MNNNTKKIVLSIIIVLFIVLLVVGSTFAFYSASQINNNAMTGSTYSFDANLTLRTVKSPGLVPTVDSLIGTSLNSANSCISVDNNGICNIYEITLKNNASQSITLTGNILTNTGTTYTTNHLKYQLYTLSGNTYSSASDARNLGYTLNSTNPFTLSSNNLTISLNGGQSKVYYLVLWLSDVGVNQLEDANKKYLGTVEFTLSSGETLTAKFTS